MGLVGSKMDKNPAIYIDADESKFFLKSIVITNSKSQAPIHITVGASPNPFVNISSHREWPIEFIFVINLVVFLIY